MSKVEYYEIEEKTDLVKVYFTSKSPTDITVRSKKRPGSDTTFTYLTLESAKQLIETVTRVLDQLEPLEETKEAEQQ